MKILVSITAAFLLAACAVPAHVVRSDGEKHVLRTKGVDWIGGSAAGVYAGALTERANLQCPNGWYKVNETTTGKAGDWLYEWHIRCN